MSRLTDLLRQARQVDPQLGADLESEIAALTKRRTFGGLLRSTVFSWL